MLESPAILMFELSGKVIVSVRYKKISILQTWNGFQIFCSRKWTTSAIPVVDKSSVRVCRSITILWDWEMKQQKRFHQKTTASLFSGLRQNKPSFKN